MNRREINKKRKKGPKTVGPMIFNVLVLLSLSFMSDAVFAESIPQTADELWQGYDASSEPLDTHVVKEFEQDGIIIQYVLFTVGTFKEKPARVAAYFAYPKGGTKLPGVVWIHGGGQYARVSDVIPFAKRGYACVSINWGGKPMNGTESSQPNTNWGAVDPTQENNSGYTNMAPGSLYLDPVDSPRNNNWYLLGLAGRRALSFLEQQSQVDPTRLGVAGHSMGGMTTVRVASDPRVKAAVPRVGGQGFKSYDAWGIPGSALEFTNPELFRKTISEESQLPLIKCPLLFVSASNDFNAPMDDVVKSVALLPNQQKLMTFSPHLNHRFYPETEVCTYLWFDEHLKEAFKFPQWPKSELALRAGTTPVYEVTPDRPGEVVKVDIYYASDRHPVSRFWSGTEAVRSGNTWSAECPVFDAENPLYAYANVFYKLNDRKEGDPETYSISSYAVAFPEELKKASVAVRPLIKSRMIDDFKNGWRDWGRINEGNERSWEFQTFKLSDPRYSGEHGDRLSFEVRAENPGNVLGVELVTNWMKKGVPTLRYYAFVPIDQTDWQTITLSVEDFKTLEGAVLKGWNEVSSLSFKTLTEIKNDDRSPSMHWKGPVLEFKHLQWVTSSRDK